MKKIFLLAFGIIAFINLFSQTNIENYIEGRKFKNAESGVVMEYGYIPSLNTKGISYTNQNGKDYVFCSKKISSDGTYMVLTRCIDQQNESVSGIMYFYRTKVIVKEPDSDRRLQFDLVDGNKNITTTKKKTTNINDDAISQIMAIYWKNESDKINSLLKEGLDVGNARPSKNASGSSPSKSSSSNTASKHTFKVTVTWNNPNCGSCPFPRPSAQNGSVDYFYERSGSYKVKPKCPICGKTQYNTIDGFTDNIGTSNQGSKVVTISCN